MYRFALFMDDVCMCIDVCMYVCMCIEALRCLCDRDGDDKLVSVFCTLVRIYVVVYVYV